MIDIFHASDALLSTIQDCANERNLLKQVETHLQAYEFAATVNHPELDIAFAAAHSARH